MQTVPDLSIVIVNWNSADFTRECLESVFANVQGLEFEVLVVDNASFDGCGEMLKSEFPDVTFLQANENLGFAKANNLAFRRSRGRNILFLNPDTEIVGTAIQEMVRFLESTPNAGIVGCKLLNSDRSIQTSCVQSFPSILNQAFDSEYLGTMFPKASLWGRRAIEENDGRPAVVEVISGACLCIKGDVFESIGLFTDDYFMYAEDCDLCYKAKQAGWKSYYLGHISVVHHGGRSSDANSGADVASVRMRQSLLEFMRTRRGGIYAAAYRATMALVSVSRISLLGVLLAFTQRSPHRSSMSRALKKWTILFGWAIGLKQESRG